jgi:ribosomal protein S18 acetylase RimI-like enzyme
VTSGFTTARADSLSTAERRALDALLAQRQAFAPRQLSVRLPDTCGQLPVCEDSVMLLAWAAPDELAAVLIGTWFPDNEPDLELFEGRSPFLAALAYFGPGQSLAALPDPVPTIARLFPRADRVTINAPIGDAMTATALGSLGFTLDSYMDLTFARHGAGRRDSAPPNELRAATAEDAEQIAELHALHVRDQVGTSVFVTAPSSGIVRYVASALRSRIMGGASIHVATSGKAVIGVIETAVVDIPDDGRVRRWPEGRAGVVQWVAVSPTHRRRGIGTALVDAGLAELWARGAEYTYVCRGANNRLSAPTFWRRFGFSPVWGTWEMELVAESD